MASSFISLDGYAGSMTAVDSVYMYPIYCSLVIGLERMAVLEKAASAFIVFCHVCFAGNIALFSPAMPYHA